MATGDMKNNVKQLQAELKNVKFFHMLDLEGVLNGSPQAYLGVYHYMFTTYSTKFNKDISNSNNELYGKSDMRFMEAVYKILRDMFNFKPQVNREQFFTPGFAECKVIMATEILRLIRSKYRPPKTSTVFKVGPAKENHGSGHGEKVQQEPVECPRKIAGKLSSTMAGAIVLPSKSRSTVNRLHSPKSIAPAMRQGHSGGSAMSAKSRPNEKSIGDAVDVTDKAGSSLHEHPHTVCTGKSPVRLDMDIRQSIIDGISPTLFSLSQRIEKIELSSKTLDDKEHIRNLPQPQADAGLSRQMADVMFKLDTITSRVVLLENRLTLVEAKLDDKTGYRKILSASQSCDKNNSQTHGRTVVAPLLHTANSSDSFEEIEVHGSNDNNDMTEHTIGDKIVAKNDPKLAFMELLVDQNETKESREERETSEISENHQPHSSKCKVIHQPSSAESSGTRQPSSAKSADIYQPTSAKSTDNHRPPSGKGSTPGITDRTNIFDDVVSPIRSFSDMSQLQYYCGQDESVISIPCATRDEDSTEDKRSSTPTHLSLDTSTLDRISRIHQMMAETHQLFQ